MQTLIKCKGCAQDKPHHAREYCINCYHKFVVRGTGDFDRGDQGFYQQHLASIKNKISTSLKIQRNKASTIVSELSQEKLKKLYCDQSLSMGDIAKQFGCSRPYVLMLLRKYGLPIRNKSNARAEAKKKGKNVWFNAINENFFKNQTPEMAYVLGYIYSDGNIANGLNYFSISQKEPEILHKIKELMGSEHTIARKKTQELSVLTIGNKVMINDLLGLGLTPNKSLDVQFPILDKNLYSHFIRGYFDGDGSILLNNNSWRVSFVSGSKLFIEGLEGALSGYAGTSKRPIYTYLTGRAFQITYFRRADLGKIYDFFYDDISIQKGVYLCRKHESFLKFKGRLAMV